MSVIEEVAAERRRQIEVEGWSADHDDEHSNCELGRAGAAYALHACRDGFSSLTSWRHRMAEIARETWPWSRAWWKPKDQRRDLIRAAALIVAEIERMDRRAERMPIAWAGEDPASPEIHT